MKKLLSILVLFVSVSCFSATISDPVKVKYCNERVRVSANKLQDAYALCDAVADRWTSLGGGATAFNVMQDDIRQAANAVVDAYQFCYLTEKLWFLHGDSSFIPNNADTVSDGAPADGRSQITGAKVHGVLTRVIEFQNWLLSSAGSFTDSTRTNVAYINTVMAVCVEGPTQTQAAAENFINRCTELRTNYEASSNANLNTILSVYVPN